MAEVDKSIAKRRIKLGSILIGSFLLLYIPSLIFWIYGKTVSTDIVRMGEIEDSINIDAYIVRDEVVLNSPIGGKCIKDINEGEKVKANSRIATVLNKSSEDLLKALKELDLQIIKDQKEKAKNLELFSGDLKKLENEIGEKLKQVISISNTNELSGIKKIKKQIDDLIQKKASIAGELSIPDAHIKSLIAQKQALQKRIEENTEDISSRTSGVVSYIVDGYENTITPGRISDLTLKDLENIRVRSAHKDIDDFDVEASKPFAKVIKDIEYYMVIPVDTDKGNSFKVDNRVNIRINEIDKVISGQIFYRSNNMNGKSIIAVKVSKALSETAVFRKINIDLIKSQYSGLKVPLKSLSNVDLANMKAEIGLVKANRAKFVEVIIVGKNEEFAIIENVDLTDKDTVNLYSTYIIDPTNIEKGQTIN